MLRYFKPKKFETIHGKSIYRYLGVRFFKKYLLLTDLVMFHWRGKRQLPISRKSLTAELKRLEWQTRRDECIHLACMFLILLVVFFKQDRLSGWRLWVIFLINIYVNIYPIFVQRFNRFRILRVLASRGEIMHPVREAEPTGQ